jgi:hypothetical protein
MSGLSLTLGLTCAERMPIIATGLACTQVIRKLQLDRPALLWQLCVCALCAEPGFGLAVSCVFGI